MGNTTVAKLRVITPETKMQSTTRRRFRPSRPTTIGAGSGVPKTPLPSILLASICEAWHDIEDRAETLLKNLQAKPV